MTDSDHYSTLGVLPEAEGIVIDAAYKALAQRYHPDKSLGNTVEANRRMAEINEAYQVLGNEKLRAEYDASRRKHDHADYRKAGSEESEEAFGAALHELEQRWSVATDIFPDLSVLRDSLKRISASLAFGFVTLLLDSKKYDQRTQIAESLERRFLERYFGSSEQVLIFAKELIASGHRDAAKTLNHLVDVMGSEVDPNLLLQRVEKQYKIRADRIQRQGLGDLAAQVCKWGYFDDACRLAKMLGYKVHEHNTGFLGSKAEIAITSPQGVVTRFHSTHGFTEWVKTNLCP